MKKSIKLRIFVDSGDILKGKRNCFNSCPIALAVKREFENITKFEVNHVNVSAEGINVRIITSHNPFSVRKLYKTRKLSPKALKFICNYDYRKEVEPFDFQTTFNIHKD